MVKKKPHLKILFPLCLTVIVALVTVFVVRSYRENQREGKIMESYLTYTGSNPALDITFQYPPHWKPVESQGRTERYDDVQVMGPRNDEADFGTSVSVTVRPMGEEDASRLLSEYLKMIGKFSGFKVVKIEDSTIARKSAARGRYEYVLRLPYRHINARDVLMREETVFVTKPGKSYRLTFTSTADQFD